MSSQATPDVHLDPPDEGRSHAQNWNDPPTRLSRSPRPYLRKRDFSTRSGPPSRSNSYLPSPALTPSQSDTEFTPPRPFPSRPPSRLDLATPGESGAEADDEGLRLVKALPPPPHPAHKGLRIEEERDGQPGVDSSKPFQAETSPQRPTSSRKEQAEVVGSRGNKLVARGRLLQRACEAACLVLVAWTSVYAPVKGEQEEQHSSATAWLRKYIVLSTAIVATLLVRRFSAYTKSTTTVIDLLGRIDPAPVLYPTLLPILITLSLGVVSSEAILLNMVLGLSAIPRRLVSLKAASGYHMVHWLLAMTPVLLYESFAQNEHRTGTWSLALHSLDEQQKSTIDVSLLFPLHQALLSPIRYLTNSSLLSSEQQLLSVGLISLLVLVNPPQLQILKYLLWLGGFGLLVLCKPILKRNVALERIPTWRFRRAGTIVRASQTFLSTLTEGLRAERAPNNVLGSDVEDDQPTQNGHTAESTKKLERHGPRLEIPDTPASPVHAPESPSTRARGHKRKPSSTIQSYLSLTPGQVTRRKWLYSLYTYIVIIALIFGPVRSTIRDNVFNGTDPFYWAVGYLLGDLRFIRSYISSSSFSDLIPLPPTSTVNTPLLHQTSPSTRLYLFAYFAAVLAIGVSTVIVVPLQHVDTRRKIFHFTMVALLFPTSYVDPAFVALGLMLVLAVFLLLEVLRAGQVRPLAKPLARFLEPYVDGRDLRGPMVVSHVFLLVGCAVPFWLSLAALPSTQVAQQAKPAESTWSWLTQPSSSLPPAPSLQDPFSGWSFAQRDVSILSGVICVGMGDAAASLIGRSIGQHKWPWPGGKSLEGSAAFALAVTFGLIVAKAYLIWGSWEDVYPFVNGAWTEWLAWTTKAGIAASAASITEAVLTGCNDNVVVPVVLWLWVRALQL